MVDFDDLHSRDVQKKLLHKTELLKNRPENRFNTDFGMIASLGGVIIIPILIGVFSGSYLEEKFPQHFSWRLSLIFLGFIWGIINAYLWIKNENRKIMQNNSEDTQKRDKHE